jgi:hypothetical protein
VGISDGDFVGANVGISDGEMGTSVGTVLGMAVEGMVVGLSDGLIVGASLLIVGTSVGSGVGEGCVGHALLSILGLGVTTFVGIRVGRLVGLGIADGATVGVWLSVIVGENDVGVKVGPVGASVMG